jgi:hypothetical protein
MIYFVDIDNTICKTEGMDYINAVPIFENIEKINELHKNNYIVYWTARGAGSGADYRELTIAQFKKWGVKYHELRLDKPLYDLLIDDRAIETKEYFK